MPMIRYSTEYKLFNGKPFPKLGASLDRSIKKHFIERTAPRAITCGDAIVYQIFFHKAESTHV